MKDDFTFTILGDDFDTRDGNLCSRLHPCRGPGECSPIGDRNICRKGGESDYFNLGTGNGTTVKEIADAVDKRGWQSHEPSGGRTVAQATLQH